MILTLWGEFSLSSGMCLGVKGKDGGCLGLEKKLLFELLKKVKYIHLFCIGSKIMKSIRKKGYGKYFILYSKFEYKCN